jgi:hypothetical protein
MESAEQAWTPSPPLKPSKSGPGVKGKGDRLLLAACLAAYFATLAAGSQLTSRIDFWKRLGVPATSVAERSNRQRGQERGCIQHAHVAGGTCLDGLSHHQELVPHAQPAGEVMDGGAGVGSARLDL